MEDEIREEIIKILIEAEGRGWDFQWVKDNPHLYRRFVNLVDQILSYLREQGWREVEPEQFFEPEPKSGMEIKSAYAPENEAGTSYREIVCEGCGQYESQCRCKRQEVKDDGN